MRYFNLDAVRGLDVRYERAEDYDLCLRLSEVTEIRCVPKPLYFYCQHLGNLTKDESEQIRWSYRAVRLCCEILNRLGLNHCLNSTRFKAMTNSVSTPLKPVRHPPKAALIPAPIPASIPVLTLSFPVKRTAH